MDGKFLLSYQEAGRVLGCTARTVFEFVKSGELRAVALGYRLKKVDPNDLRDFIERKKTTAKAGAV
jgi:excisionase family DNA binding protein